MQVIQTIQSIEFGTNEPAEVTFYKGDDHVQALSALVSCAATPPNPYFRVVSVRMEF